ncbi:DnaJ domain [Trypanosoma melophagium]|uniref:DnaJ domain n=1 Tax=Trypanosoma melophagium TaxID=715481 RepID=UPI003519F9BD|nr:DnaJ domain [Trypanosoma melophagium]
MFYRRVTILRVTASSSSSSYSSSSSGSTKQTRIYPPSPYDVLGVTPNTPFSEVKARFQQLTRHYHPDMPHGDPGKFREINAAYRLIRAAQRERKSENINAENSSRSGSESRNFWSGRDYRNMNYREHDDTQAHEQERRDRYADPKRNPSYLRDIMWFYEGYELAFVLGAAVAVLLIAVDRYILVQRMTREKRARLRAMDEGLPPSMPMVIDDDMLQKYSEHVPQEAIDIDNAMVKENAYYRRATQRRFEDFREFLFIYDPDGVTSRKVTTSRFSIQYMDENLIPRRCTHVREFNSEEKNKRYGDIIKDVSETLSTTPWVAPDAQFITPLIAKGLATIPMNSPDTAKWTFIEYKDNDTGADSTCLMALKNNRFESLGMSQRVTVTGSSKLSPRLVEQREAELQAGTLTKKELQQGGKLPVKDLSIPLEHMRL